MAEKETRNFALRDKDGNEIGVFTGKQPRQAALKAKVVVVKRRK
jgi:hypothetical protein